MNRELFMRTSKLRNFIELVGVLAIREIKSRYKGSLLGPLWVILYPLILTAVTSLVFSRFIKLSTDNVPYFIFALSGLVSWNYFTKSLSLGTKSLAYNRQLIVETSVDAEAIPLSYILGQLPDVVINTTLLFIALAITKLNFSLIIVVFTLIYFLLLTIFTFGLALVCSALNVVYKDTQNLLDPMLLVWFYLTPIVYSSNLVPEEFQWLLIINPLALFVNSYRNVTIYQVPLHMGVIITVVIFSVVSLIIGILVFRRYRPIFADII